MRKLTLDARTFSCAPCADSAGGDGRGRMTDDAWVLEVASHRGMEPCALGQRGAVANADPCAAFAPVPEGSATADRRPREGSARATVRPTRDARQATVLVATLSAAFAGLVGETLSARGVTGQRRARPTGRPVA